MKYFYFLMLTLLSHAALSQYSGGPLQMVKKSDGSTMVNGKITGVILDSLSGNPVEFASVALMDSGTGKPVNGTMCDEKGKFTIQKVAEGNYKVVVSFVGFSNRSVDVQITADKEDVDLGTIILSPKPQILKEVVVEGIKTLIEEKVDRTIYNAENDMTTRGGDATDVLKRVPMLSVDLDGNVSMRGSQNIKVLINNKPSTIAASSVADALKMIPADQIKSVEVITSPSAKYDAEGSGGIINIITKKNNLQGIVLNVDAGAGYRGSNLGLNGSYRKKNVGFSLGGFGRAGYNINGSSDIRQITGGSEIIQHADTRSQNIFGNYTLGWDYDINKNNSLAASVKYGVRNNNSFQDNLYTIKDGDTQSTGNVKTTDESGNVDASLNYTHTFAKPQREFSVLTMYSRNDRVNNFLNTSYFTVDPTRRNKNLNNSYNQEVTIQADYQTPLMASQLLEFGAKNIARTVSSDYTYFVAYNTDGDYMPSTTQSPNVFNYTQNVTAGYASFTQGFLKTYTVKAGARYEYTSINANFQRQQSDAPPVDDIPSYSIVVPSINLSKKLKSGNTVKASYNRRIQRPSIQFLNPSIQNSNNLNYSQGNPNLSPEFTNNYEVGYNTYIKGSSLNISAFARNTNNSIQNVRDTLPNGGILTTYRNIGKEAAYGSSIFANINLGNSFSLNGGTDIYYAVLKNNVSDPRYNASNQGWVVSYRLFGNYNIGKGWGVQFFGFYRGKQVQLQGSQSGFGIYSLGLKKDFNQKRGSVGFGAENFFTPAFKVKSESVSPLLTQNSTMAFHNMNFKITFSYRIGKMSFDFPKRSKSINNDDLKQEGDNDTTGSGMQQQGGGMQQGGPRGGGMRQGGGPGFGGQRGR